MRKRPEKIVWVVTVIIIVTIVLVAGVMANISSSGIRVWIGDYKVAINTDCKTVDLLDYHGDENMVIPSMIGPFSVVHVNRDLFTGKDNITSIYIASEIDPQVLFHIEDCINLKRIEFEEGIKAINLHVYDCNNLEELIIPDGPETIDCSCLRCASLEKIKLPSTLKSTDGCDFMQSKFEEVHGKDKYYVVGDGILLFSNIDIEKDIVIPQGVKYYKDSLRLNESIKRKIYIPESMKSLALDVNVYDTIYFGGEDFESFELNVGCIGSYTNDIKITIVAPANSYAEEFCKERGYNFRVMTDEEEKEWREKTEAAASEITYQE